MMRRSVPVDWRVLRGQLGVLPRLLKFDALAAELTLLGWPLAWALLLAGGGRPSSSALLTVVWSGFWLRSGLRAYGVAAEGAGGPVGLWRHRPLRGLAPLTSRDALYWSGASFLLGGLPLFLAGAAPGALGAAVAACAAAIPVVSRHSFLAEAAAGVTVGLGVLAVWHLTAGGLSQAAGLTAVAAALWSTALFLAPALPLQAASPERSMAVLFGPFLRWAAPLLQAAALVALAPLGRLLGLGVFFDLGLLAAGAVALHGHLVGHGDGGGVPRHGWFGAVLFLGMGFDFLCRAQHL